MKRAIIQLLIAVLLLAVGMHFADKIGRSKPKLDNQVAAPLVPLVETATIAAPTHEVRLKVSGEMQAQRELRVSPQLSGKVVHLHDELMVGGRLTAGDTLLRIEDRDYRIALRQQLSQLEQAKVELELEKGRGAVAEREWKLLGEAFGDPAKGGLAKGDLAKRLPQAQAARLAVDAAEAGLDQAKLNLRRTTIKAPFNAAVINESVELGQIVAPGSQLCTLVGTDALWARVRVPMDDLPLIVLPGQAETEKAPLTTAKVRPSGVASRAWPARVDRLVQELDTETRSAQLLLMIDQPFDPGEGQLPLLPGTFVEAEISTRSQAPLYAVPRLALHHGKFVWALSSDDKLERRPLSIVWGDAQQVWVRDGLRSGDRVVLSPTSRLTVGMDVRPASGANAATAELAHD